MVTPTVIHGVSFFNTPSSCIEHFQQLPWNQRMLSLTCSIGRIFSIALVYQILRFVYRYHVNPQIKPYITPQSSYSKERLVVCLHGLNSSPNYFKEVVAEMHHYDLSNTHIYTPILTNRGNAKLDDVVKPIFEHIKKWAQTPGEKQLVLIGISNGARAARAINAEILHSKETENINKLRVVSIVGSNQGSTAVNFAHKARLAWLMSKPMAEEMPTYSQRHAQLNQALSSLEASPIAHDYTFLASPHDCLVPNYDSTLMKMPQKIPARYALIPYYGHHGVERAASKAIAQCAVG